MLAEQAAQWRLSFSLEEGESVSLASTSDKTRAMERRDVLDE